MESDIATIARSPCPVCRRGRGARRSGSCGASSTRIFDLAGKGRRRRRGLPGGAAASTRSRGEDGGARRGWLCRGCGRTFTAATISVFGASATRATSG